MQTTTRAAVVAFFALFLQTAGPDGWLGFLKFWGVGVANGLVEYIVHFTTHKGGSETTKHRTHHANPNDVDRIALSNFLFVKLLILMTTTTVLFPLLPVDVAVYVTLWYGIYEVYHGMLHDGKDHGYMIERARRYHDVHHDKPLKNFGVTTTGWDMLFGTDFVTDDLSAVLGVVPIVAFV